MRRDTGDAGVRAVGRGKPKPGHRRRRVAARWGLDNLSTVERVAGVERPARWWRRRRPGIRAIY
jgi:hypothetical protein